ncbi:P-loop containing nucleoside triphosphate hydrolase protein [Cladochytrium replicatum]|nr:P-loop containing nucleoside triphosphate hydrolase protein [Cladochytrium replicatum]
MVNRFLGTGNFPGYPEQAGILAELLGSCLQLKNLGTSSLNLRKGICLSGPPRSGKSFLVNHVCLDVLQIPLLEFDCLSFASTTDGEIDETCFLETLGECFQQIPCALLVKGLDGSTFENEEFRRKCAESLVRNLTKIENESLGVVYTVSDWSRVHQYMRSSVQLFSQLSIFPPTNDQAVQIALFQMESSGFGGGNSPESQRTAEMLVKSTTGMVAGDIHQIVSYAARIAWQRQCILNSVSIDDALLSDATLKLGTTSLDSLTDEVILLMDQTKISGGESAAQQISGTHQLLWSDCLAALKAIHPTNSSPNSQRESRQRGYFEQRKKLQWLVYSGSKPARFGLKPPSGILLFGPTGCGKTSLIRELVEKSSRRLISVNGSELFSKYFGETEAQLRQVFATARNLAPSVLFFDNLEAICSSRDWTSTGAGAAGVNERLLSTLLNELDGIEERVSDVLICACTHRPWKLDPAILRPGRFDRHIFLPLPTKTDRIEILRMTILLKVMSGDQIHILAAWTHGFSCADLLSLVREAVTVFLRDIRPAAFGGLQLDLRHFVTAILGFHADIPSTKEMLTSNILRKDLLCELDEVDRHFVRATIQKYRGGSDVRTGWWTARINGEDIILSHQRFASSKTIN